MQSLANTRVFAFVGLFVSLLFLSLHEPEVARRKITTPVLQTFNGSLTTYLPATATPSQDLIPQATQRGTALEGSFASRPVQPMRIEANPYESVWSDQQVNGVDLFTGGYDLQDIDIALPADGFSWVVGRSYNALQGGGSHHDSDGYQGRNWFQSSTPELQLHEHATNDANDVLYLYYGAAGFAEYW